MGLRPGILDRSTGLPPGPRRYSRTTACRDELPTIARLAVGRTALDRTTINAWKDAGFKQAVRAVGRRPSAVAS